MSPLFSREWFRCLHIRAVFVSFSLNLCTNAARLGAKIKLKFEGLVANLKISFIYPQNINEVDQKDLQKCGGEQKKPK